MNKIAFTLVFLLYFAFCSANDTIQIHYGQFLENSIDHAAPISFVEGLPSIVNSDSVLVSWQGTDAGAGIQYYTIYYSEDNSEYIPWLSNVSSESRYFFGEDGKTYYFYSIASDKVGLSEASKDHFEAVTSFDIKTESNRSQVSEHSGGLHIYPNPSECCFMITTDFDRICSKTISIYNISGALLYEQDYNTDEINLDLSGTEKGIYQVVVTNGEHSARGKIVLF